MSELISQQGSARCGTDPAHAAVTNDRPIAPFDAIGVRLAIAELRRNNAAGSVDFIPAYGWEDKSDLQPSDILQVDFGCRRVDSDGVYLIETTNLDGGVWRGVMRFFVHPKGLEHKPLRDEAWSTDHLEKRVIGRAIRVYKMTEVPCG